MATDWHLLMMVVLGVLWAIPALFALRFFVSVVFAALEAVVIGVASLGYSLGRRVGRSSKDMEDEP